LHHLERSTEDSSSKVGAAVPERTTTFFQQLGTISNPFLIGLITTLVNVLSTPISFWMIEFQ
jgi:hypothetical protein